MYFYFIFLFSLSILVLLLLGIKGCIHEYILKLKLYKFYYNCII